MFLQPSSGIPLHCHVFGFGTMDGFCVILQWTCWNFHRNLRLDLPFPLSVYYTAQHFKWTRQNHLHILFKYPGAQHPHRLRAVCDSHCRNQGLLMGNIAQSDYHGSWRAADALHPLRLSQKTEQQIFLIPENLLLCLKFPLFMIPMVFQMKTYHPKIIQLPVPFSRSSCASP